MGKAGLYIHIPFCRSKCPYCDFYSVRYNEEAAEKYTDAVIEKMSGYSGEFDTIYFGGGTPSIVDSKLIGKLTAAAREHFAVDKNAEITVECNPSKNLERDFYDYASYGVNRISLGMQSAVNEERFALGRRAGRVEVIKAVNYARSAGINNISLDIMLGTPKQTDEGLAYTLDFIDKMQVPHISAYMLKLEPGTRFFDMRDSLALPDEDAVCEMYLKTVSSLAQLGLAQYEISNFSRPGFESRHNLKYWLLDDYLGLGASAHSLWQGKRFYYDEKLNKIPAGDGGDVEERIMLGLRLSGGIEASLINKSRLSLVEQYVSSGLMKYDKTKISLTPNGMLLSNVIIASLL